MPGLIDAHIHAYAQSVNFYENTASPDTLAACWAGHMLSNMLDRGFTTVRDTGGADYGLFLGIERGYVRGPRLFYCGHALSQTGGHGDFRNPQAHHACDDAVLSCGCGQVGLITAVVDGVDALRRVVRENLFRGASFIKFAGSGGVSSTGDKLSSIQFSDEEVRAIVDEAERHGVYCTAHIHPDRAARRAVELGVHCIEHGTLIEQDTARMAADAGVSIVPTMAVIWALGQEGAKLGYPPQAMAKLALVQEDAVKRLGHMKSAGVRVGYGTDLLGPTERFQLEEFRLRNSIYSSFEILKQATSENARILRAEGDIGIVRPGAHADFLILSGDPFLDIEAIAADNRPRTVIKAGQVVHDGLGIAIRALA